MNFITQFKCFYNFIVKHKISAKAQALYYLLFALFNANYFNCFKVSCKDLQKILHICTRDIYRLRNELLKNGLIEYERKKGEKNGLYSICCLYEQKHCAIYDTQNVNDCAIYDTQNVGVKIIETNKTKEIYKENKSFKKYEDKFKSDFKQRTYTTEQIQNLFADMKTFEFF